MTLYFYIDIIWGDRMEFRWNEWNVEHVWKHGVYPAEAEAVVLGARRPYPIYRGDGKYLVWGPGKGGRLLQVIYLLEADELMYVIHARPLTDGEKRQLMRRRRRRGER